MACLFAGGIGTMSPTNDSSAVVDESFLQIANADIESILKELTGEEKIALLTGMTEPIGSCYEKQK